MSNHNTEESDENYNRIIIAVEFMADLAAQGCECAQSHLRNMAELAITKAAALHELQELRMSAPQDYHLCGAFMKKTKVPASGTSGTPGPTAGSTEKKPAKDQSQ